MDCVLFLVGVGDKAAYDSRNYLEGWIYSVKADNTLLPCLRDIVDISLGGLPLGKDSLR